MEHYVLPDTPSVMSTSTAHTRREWKESFGAADRSAWLEVDLDAIADNTRHLRAIVGSGVAVLGVVKADGYGHDAVLAARAMLCGGATSLGVATVGEGQRL